MTQADGTVVSIIVPIIPFLENKHEDDPLSAPEYHYDQKMVSHILIPHPIDANLEQANTRSRRVRANYKCIKLAPGTDHCLAIWEINGNNRVFSIGSNQDSRGGFDATVKRVDHFTEVRFFVSFCLCLLNLQFTLLCWNHSH